jgi:hypothetical protein
MPEVATRGDESFSCSGTTTLNDQGGKPRLSELPTARWILRQRKVKRPGSRPRPIATTSLSSQTSYGRTDETKHSWHDACFFPIAHAQPPVLRPSSSGATVAPPNALNAPRPLRLGAFFLWSVKNTQPRGLKSGRGSITRSASGNKPLPWFFLRVCSADVLSGDAAIKRPNASFFWDSGSSSADFFLASGSIDAYHRHTAGRRISLLAPFDPSNQRRRR